MSIANRMASYELLRSTDTLDQYGIMSATPAKVKDVMVSITKNSPIHEITNPLFTITEYVGITQDSSVQVGDILKQGSTQYQVKDIGNKLTLYTALFLNKI